MRFDPKEGVTLDLDGLLKPEDINLSSPEIPMILGVAYTGEFISIPNAFATRLTHNLIGTPTSELHSSMVLLGAHFPTTELLQFTKLLVRFTHLEDWAGITGLTMKLDTTNRDIEVRYSVPQTTRASLNAEHSISIQFGVECQAEQNPLSMVALTHYDEVAFESTAPMPLEDALRDVYDFQNFLTLGVDAVCVPISICAVIPVVAEGGQSRQNKVKVHFALSTANHLFVRINRRQMLFSLPDVGAEFESTIKNWFASADRLRPSHLLYFGTIQDSRGIVENRFLSLAQALEVYHRRTFVNEQLPAQDHQKRVLEIIDTAPGQHQTWLRERLEYSNEPNLRKRLKELLDVAPECTDRIVSDRKSFINDVVNTRNNLTHYSRPPGHLEKDAFKLYKLAEQLSELMRVFLLRELAFEFSKISELLDAFERFNPR